MADRIGQQFGNYRLTRLLGKGGFAEVYLGEHLLLKNHAALKVLFASPTDKQEQDFLAEAQTLASLTHPHIVRVREFAVVRRTPFLAMDYTPGGTLRQRYPQGTCLSLEKTVAYVKQAAAALQYAHNHHIIHRDVKPANFLLDAWQNLVLSDFGISLLSSPDPQPMAGTLPYMAPEQIMGQANFASDQYSLGIVTYEWLCGTRPFEDGFVHKHTSVAPPRLREKDASLPEEVEAVVLKALAKNPRDRYPSVLQFARALEMASQRNGYVLSSDDESTYSPNSDIPRRVFLSTNAPEAPFMTQFKADLMARDILIEGDISGEQSKEEDVRQAIRAAQLVLLVSAASEQPLSVLNEHIRIANIYRQHIVIVNAVGTKVQEQFPEGIKNFTVIDASGATYKKALSKIMIYLERERKGPPLTVPTSYEAEFEPRNPYKGLLAFTQDDAGDFFGRDTLIQQMVKTLGTLILSSSSNSPVKRMLTVIGPSGSGKSSVVMAGLLPRLQQGALSRSETWIYLDPMVPGQHPLDSLAYTLAPHFPEKSKENIREILSKDDSYGLHQLATSLAQQQKMKVVLLIDQFEELFLPEISEHERKQIIDLIMTAITEPRGSVVVLLTLRADCYDRPLAYSTLGCLVEQQQCVVMPMELDDLRTVIERPAELSDVWLTFESDLVGDLLFEVRGQVGALPLIQFTLDQLFHSREGHQLTRKAYQEMGGVKGALSKHAEATYAALPSEAHRKLARALFVRLVNPSETGQAPTRRRSALSEFSFEDLSQTQCMQETIDAFLAARLLTSNQVAGITALEVSHEALLGEWSRLKGWIDDTQEDIRLQQKLSRDVAEWEQRDKSKDQLYPRSQLIKFKSWRERNLTNKQEMAFLTASARQQIRVRISTVVIVLLVLLLLIPTATFAWRLFIAS